MSGGDARGHFVYIVRCADGTLYTGYARDPQQREQVHNRGRGARYTAGRRPVSLVYTEACRSRSEALTREHRLKGWTRARKEALIRRHFDRKSGSVDTAVTGKGPAGRRRH